MNWRGRIVLLAGLAAVLAAACIGGAVAEPGQPTDPRQTFCVVAGVADYAHGGQARSAAGIGLSDLRYTATEARQFTTMLQAAGVPSANIRLRLDGAATAGVLRADLNWLKQRSRRADTVLFYFCGHGTNAVPDLDGDEFLRQVGDRWDEALLTADALDLTRVSAHDIAARPALRQRYLTSLLLDDEVGAFAASCKCPVLLVFDSCYAAGSFLDTPSEQAEARWLPLAAQPLRPPDAQLFIGPCEPPRSHVLPDAGMDTPDNAACLAAAGAGQTAVEDKELQATWFGYALRSVLATSASKQTADTNGDRAVSLAEVFTAAALTVRRLSEQQRAGQPLSVLSLVPEQTPEAINLNLADDLSLGRY